MTMPTATREIQPARRTRSDGDRSRQRILEAAAQLATVQGLDRLSIGELAAHIGMSKAACAHFRSKKGSARRSMRPRRLREVVVEPMLRPSPASGRPCLTDASSPRSPDLPGRLLLRRLGRDPVPGGAVRADRRVRQPMARLLRRTSLPRRPGTSPRARTSTRSSSRIDAYLLYAHAAFGFRGNRGPQACRRGVRWRWRAGARPVRA
jgi:AcrR family transcriptional regulator